MKNVQRSFIVLTVIFASLLGQGLNKTGTTAANFLKIGAGSRAIGMGGAFVSIADDASSLYWNPGGLAILESNELVANHTKWIADIGYTFFGLALPIPSIGTIGISAVAMTMDEMDVTTYGNENGTGQKFKAGSFAVGISYARRLTDRFSIGGTAKYISELISQTTASGLALDIGTLYVTPFNGIRFGASISNFGQKLQMFGEDLLVNKDVDESIHGNNTSVNAHLSTDPFDLPLLLRVGISGDAINTDRLRVTWAIDGNHPNDNSEYVNTGMEIGLMNDLIALRGGLKSLFMEDGDEEYTLGGGLHYPLPGNTQFWADYAFESWKHFKPTHKFTIRIVF